MATKAHGTVGSLCTCQENVSIGVCILYSPMQRGDKATMIYNTDRTTFSGGAI